MVFKRSSLAASVNPFREEKIKSSSKGSSENTRVLEVKSQRAG